MCKNIELFNKCCVSILGRLYASFPVSERMQSHDVASLVGVEGLDSGAMLIYAETVTFLAQEGFITVGGTSSGHGSDRIFMGVRLTSKGLAALNRTPKELDAAPSVGERIAGWTGDLIKDASREAVKGVVQALLSPF